MNISVYIPNSLMEHFESYIKNNDTTRNAAIRKAMELLLQKEKETTWGNWIEDLESDIDYKPAESHRSDLAPPSKDVFL